MSSKKRHKAPTQIAVETIYDVHITITVRGVAKGEDSGLEDFVTALLEEHLDDPRNFARGRVASLVDVSTVDARYVCDGAADEHRARAESMFDDSDDVTLGGNPIRSAPEST